MRFGLVYAFSILISEASSSSEANDDIVESDPTRSEL